MIYDNVLILPTDRPNENGVVYTYNAAQEVLARSNTCNVFSDMDSVFPKKNIENIIGDAELTLVDGELRAKINIFRREDFVSEVYDITPHCFAMACLCVTSPNEDGIRVHEIKEINIALTTDPTTFH